MPTITTGKPMKTFGALAQIETLQAKIKTLKTENADLKAKLAAKPKAKSKPAPAKSKASPTASTVAKPQAGLKADEYSKRPVMSRTEFGKLSPADRTRFATEGGKLTS